MKLGHEFSRYADAIDEARLGRLKALGVTGAGMARAGLVGVARIETDGSHWQPEESGTPALIIPAGIDNGFSSIVDMIALQTSTPDIWWSRTGFSAMLGFDSLSRCMFYGTQLTIHANPLDWLKSDCEGICLLDWNRYLPMWLSGIQSIYCPDPSTGEKLSAALTQNIFLPEIRVGDIQHAA
ncbi:MAG: hypothetical protein V7727_11045 [Sneathiella sp.]